MQSSATLIPEILFRRSLLGGVIGFEREAADKPAGFRAHMLVAGAAALLVGLSSALIESFGADSVRGS